ncbi:MAG: radical SAM protein [bacterium]|nr:radical SAM protein [bacterium]
MRRDAPRAPRPPMTPSYARLHRDGGLRRRAAAALALQSPCRLCPRACAADRAGGARGRCGTGTAPKVFRAAPHPGEEPPLSGTAGSGTVFFSGCGLRCSYCQNHPFSQGGAGVEIGCGDLAAVFLGLQARGCHNINLVTPSHFLPQVLAALDEAAGAGLDLPLVWNTSGYESPAALALLDGCVDVYLADMRYDSPAAAAAYSDAADYPAVNREAIAEMWRQAGPLAVDARGIAARGLIVRHLVLPGGAAGTAGVCRFLARRVSREVTVSLMAQYVPCGRARDDPVIGRPVTPAEYREAAGRLAENGLRNGWVQDLPAPGGAAAGRAAPLLGERFECNLPAVGLSPAGRIGYNHAVTVDRRVPAGGGEEAR